MRIVQIARGKRYHSPWANKRVFMGTPTPSHQTLLAVSGMFWDLAEFTENRLFLV
jgi:hypothetical protein